MLNWSELNHPPHYRRAAVGQVEESYAGQCTHLLQQHKTYEIVN